MTFFRGKYRKNSIRRPNFDYSSTGYYFITILTKERKYFFSSVLNKKMQLNDTGKIVWECWRTIPDHYPNAKLGAFVVMPNHIHGIVIICRCEACLAPTLGNVIGSFKSAVTKIIRESGNPDFGWHRRYHDRVIRDPVELAMAEEYIRTNPERWGDTTT